MTSTALLIMDVQQGIVDRFAGHDGGYLDRLATAIAAALADGRLDADPEMLLHKVFPRQAEVTTIADWAAGLPAA